MKETLQYHTLSVYDTTVQRAIDMIFFMCSKKRFLKNSIVSIFKIIEMKTIVAFV